MANGAGRRSRIVRGAAAAAGMTACLAGVAATGPARHPADALPAGPGLVTAVAAVSASHPVGGPGVLVRRWLPEVGVEVVSGTPAALARLAAAPGVTGVRRDGAVRTAGDAVSATAPGVFAWQGLGTRAGRPDAGAGVTVALVDSGVSDTPALDRASGRLVDGVDTSPVVDGGEPVTDGTFTDGFGHGTFLATVLAGGRVAGSGRGVGVAPAARVVNVKVATADGASSLVSVLAGLDWVASHRPIDVVVLALAADTPSNGYGADPLTSAVRRLRSTGVTVVVAAGNDADRVGDPGSDPRGITVGAADTTGATPDVAPFSGSAVVAGVAKPDVVAAGVRVKGLLPDGSAIAAGYPGGRPDDGFWRGSGTSEASAVAGGVAAIYLAAHPNAGPGTVKAAIRGAAAPLAGGVRAGAGLLAVPSYDDPTDPNGEAGFDKAAWWANSLDHGSWVDDLDAAWATDTWTADAWTQAPWAGDSWSAKSWSAKSWSAKRWSSDSWSAKSWSAKSWSAKSWSAKSWSGFAWGDEP